MAVIKHWGFWFFFLLLYIEFRAKTWVFWSEWILQTQVLQWYLKEWRRKLNPANRVTSEETLNSRYEVTWLVSNVWVILWFNTFPFFAWSHTFLGWLSLQDTWQIVKLLVQWAAAKKVSVCTSVPVGYSADGRKIMPNS